jgi:hypothetical protein
MSKVKSGTNNAFHYYKEQNITTRDAENGVFAPFAQVKSK